MRAFTPQREALINKNPKVSETGTRTADEKYRRWSSWSGEIYWKLSLYGMIRCFILCQAAQFFYPQLNCSDWRGTGEHPVGEYKGTGIWVVILKCKNTWFVEGRGESKVIGEIKTCLDVRKCEKRLRDVDALGEFMEKGKWENGTEGRMYRVMCHADDAL